MKKDHTKRGRESSLSPEEKTRLDSLPEDLSHMGPATLREHLQNARVATAFLERLRPEGQSTLELVSAIMEAFHEKEVRKSAKRALFRLKQSGIKVPEGKKEDSPIFLGRLEETPQPRAYLSPPDGLGTRALFLSIPKAPTGVDLGMGIISDEKGMLEFIFGTYSKKKAREMTELFFKNIPRLLETSLAHAATVLESAYTRGKSGPNGPAGDYLKLRPMLLETASLLQTPPIYDLVPPDSASDLLLTESHIEKLLGHEWMETWVLEPDVMKPLLEEIARTEQSPILVSPEQKATRVREAKENFLSKIYMDERRFLMKARLEEIAYLFHKTGEEDRALIALSAARSMEGRSSAFIANPFLTHLIDRSLRIYLETVKGLRREGVEKSPKEPSSRIILPR